MVKAVFCFLFCLLSSGRVEWMMCSQLVTQVGKEQVHSCEHIKHSLFLYQYLQFIVLFSIQTAVNLLLPQCVCTTSPAIANFQIFLVPKYHRRILSLFILQFFSHLCLVHQLSLNFKLNDLELCLMLQFSAWYIVDAFKMLIPFPPSPLHPLGNNNSAERDGSSVCIVNQEYSKISMGLVLWTLL